MTPETFTARLQQLAQALDCHRSRFPAEIGELSTLQQDFAAKLERTQLSAQGQTLNIGIIGQVNAGKSSFLNALLFDGKPVLPEAATPKTANLTRITYADTPSLLVRYYAPEAWAQLKTLAASDGQYAEARVARELMAMVQAAGVDAAAVLAKGEERIQTADIAALIGLLNDYAGNNGRHTALVEATELFLPREELKGIEVVDTPGMNDPVASRTQKTREYMARCDAVFFLSRCSQFLDQSDMNLLAEQLPSRGVKRLILVACQFDGAILDDGYDRDSLAETEANLTRRLGQRAATELAQQAAARERQGAPDVAALLRQIQAPLFASSYAHGFAHWPAERWSAGMLHAHGELTRLAAETWDGYAFTAEDWRRIGNFEALTAAYAAARADKEALLAAQRAGLLPENERRLREILEQLGKVAEERGRKLRDEDISQLAGQQTAAETRIAAIAGALAEIINRYREQAWQTHGRMRAELLQGLASFAKLETRTGTEPKRQSREVDDSTWWNPFSWGSTRTEYYTETAKYRYLAAADAIERVSQYAQDNAAALQHEFNRLINPAQLRAELREALLNQLDTSQDDFNPALFRYTLEGSLKRLRLPVLQLNLGDPARAVSAQFIGEVRDDQQMEQLRQTLLQALQAVFRQLDGELNSGVESLCAQLDTLCDSLADNMAKDVRNELEQLTQAFANKERELAHCQEVLAIAREFGK